MRRAHFALGALAAGLLIAGCGGGDDDVGLGTAVGAGGAAAGSGGSGGKGGTGGKGGAATGGAGGSSGGSAGAGGEAGAGGASGQGGSNAGGASGEGGSSTGGASGEGGSSTGGASGEGGSAGEAGQGGSAGSGGTCGGAADQCPGVPVTLVGSGTDPRLGVVKGDSSAFCSDYEGTCGFTHASKDSVYSVTAAVTGTLTVDTTGSAAVLNGYDPVLYVRKNCADSTTQLACSDVPPPQIDTLSVPLFAGETVYVFVDSFDGSAGIYQVNFKLQPSVCGNGVLDPDEECDDGNLKDGDGCTAGCKIDTSIVGDNCPGGTLLLTGTGTQRQGTAIGNTSFLANDTDSNTCGGVYAGEGVFSFTSDINGTATVSLGGSAVTPFDSVLYVRTNCSDKASQVECDDTATPGAESMEFNVIAGTPYYVFVDGIQGATGPFQAQVTVNAAACGNGKKEGAEECDDGNPTPGDGCSPSCTFEPAGPSDVCPGVPIALTKTGSSWTGTATGTTLNLTGTYSGSCGSLSDANDAVYSLASAPAGKATITISNATFDAVLYVRSGSCDGTEVECDDAIGDGGDQVVFDTTAGSNYWVFVDGYSGEAGSFTLNVSVQEPACGNGVLESAESCDDGDLVAGDGCDGQCHYEGQCGSLAEVEPNPYNTPQVIPAACGSFLLQGSMPLGDADYYQLDLLAGTTLSAWTFVGVPGQCNSSTDTVLSLFSSPMPAGTKESGGCGTGYVACDDQDSDNSPCSAFTQSVATSATYVLKVHNYYTSKEIPSYGVMVSIH